MEKIYEPAYLKLWTRPDSYFGEVWHGYYVFLGQHRDSDILTRSNFISGLESIGGESETVHLVRESHWAVGWVEWIAIHQDDSSALEKADSIMRRLEDYPVIDEQHWSEMEWEEAESLWSGMTVRDRADYCQKAGISIFAARRDYIPEDPNGYLFSQLVDCL